MGCPCYDAPIEEHDDDTNEGDVYVPAPCIGDPPDPGGGGDGPVDIGGGTIIVETEEDPTPPGPGWWPPYNPTGPAQPIPNPTSPGNPPGGGNPCKCVVISAGPVITQPGSQGSGNKYRQSFKQECKMGTTNPDPRSLLLNRITTINAQRSRNLNVSPAPGQGCRNAQTNKCDQPCPDVVISWEDRREGDAVGGATQTPAESIPFFPGIGNLGTIQNGGQGGSGGGTTNSGGVTYQGGNFDPFYGVEFPIPNDQEMDPYDGEYNLRIPADPTIALLAGENFETLSKSGDRNNVLNKNVSRSVYNLLLATKSSSFVRYNGTEIGSIIYGGAVINNLSPEYKELLLEIKENNMVSYNLKELLERAITIATYKGKLDEYTKRLLKDIISSSSLVHKNPDFRTSTMPSLERGYAFERIRNTRVNALPKNHTNGDTSRKIQMMWMPPIDYNLKLVVGARNGTTGVSIFNDNTFSVARTYASPSTEKITQLHDFLTIYDRNGNKKSVKLKSNRGNAYVFDLPELSLIHGQVRRSTPASREDRTPESYVFELEVSAPASVESSSVTLNRAYLVKLDNTTIEDSPTTEDSFRKTTATYNTVWRDGMSTSIFDATVSSYSGPRNTVYIDEEDPWWNSFIADGYKLTANFYDLDIDGLDGKIYPRRINVDMLLVPTNKVKYNPLQAQSTILEYTDSVVRRSLSVTIAPTKEVFKRSYATPVKKSDGLSYDLRTDYFAYQYQKGFETNALKLEVGDTLDNFTTSKSSLAEALERLDSINSNYNLFIGAGRYALPKMDFYSFYTLPQILNYIYRIPGTIRDKIVIGAYNNIRLIDVLRRDQVKSFLTEERLTGTSLDGERYYNKVSNLDNRYFDPKYKNILFRR